MSHNEESRMTKYVYRDDDPEISGFGGGYESACRAMVAAGMEWFDANPAADPKFHGFKGVYGLIDEDNADAEALSAAVAAGCPGGGCTGAMHQATISHVLYARKHGWDKYLADLRKRPKTVDA